MDVSQFEAELADGGFTAPISGDYPPGCINHDHTHPFEVLGLVLSGQMSVTGGGVTQRCGPGGIFVMRCGETHREDVGPDGVRYLYGSRPASSPPQPGR